MLNIFLKLALSQKADIWKLLIKQWLLSLKTLWIYLLSYIGLKLHLIYSPNSWDFITKRRHFILFILFKKIWSNFVMKQIIILMRTIFLIQIIRRLLVKYMQELEKNNSNSHQKWSNSVLIANVSEKKFSSNFEKYVQKNLF